MRQALEGGQMDLIGMGRPFIVDPEFPAKLIAGAIDAAPAVERDFPPAADMPRGAGLNWFCTQLALLGQEGRTDLAMPVEEGHRRYLDRIAEATAALRKTG